MAKPIKNSTMRRCVISTGGSILVSRSRSTRRKQRFALEEAEHECPPGTRTPPSAFSRHATPPFLLPARTKKPKRETRAKRSVVHASTSLRTPTRRHRVCEISESFSTDRSSHRLLLASGPAQGTSSIMDTNRIE